MSQPEHDINNLIIADETALSEKNRDLYKRSIAIIRNSGCQARDVLVYDQKGQELRNLKALLKSKLREYLDDKDYEEFIREISEFVVCESIVIRDITGKEIPLAEQNQQDDLGEKFFID